MNIFDAYPSKYLKANDLQGRVVKVVIQSIAFEQMQDGTTKPILYFQGKEKGVALNRTNASAIADDFGSETEQWVGQTIELFSMKVPFQGKMTDSIRVRAVFPPRQQSSAPPQRPIGPPQQYRQGPPEPPPPSSADEYGASQDFNDEIPF